MLALSARSGQLAARIGPRLQLSVGPIMRQLAGVAMLTLATSGSSYVVYVLQAVTVFGLGLAITVAPLTAAAMGSAPAEHSGIASAVNNDVARVGGLLAVAVLPALTGITGTAYLNPAALAAGFRTAALISGAMCAAGGLLALFTITNPAHVPQPAGAPVDQRMLQLRPRRTTAYDRRGKALTRFSAALMPSRRAGGKRPHTSPASGHDRSPAWWPPVAAVRPSARRPRSSTGSTIGTPRKRWHTRERQAEVLKSPELGDGRSPSWSLTCGAPYPC